MKKRLVIAGAGHAHMETLATLNEFTDKGYDVSVIGPSEYHYYSGMGPGMLGDIYTPEQIRFAVRRVTEKMGATFVCGKVVRIEPETCRVHLESGDTIFYDVLSCNLGSQVPEDMVCGSPEDIFFVKPIERLHEARQRILALAASRPITVGIVGGGPSAVEIAGNIRRLDRKAKGHPLSITILAGNQLLPHHPESVRRRVENSLRTQHIRIERRCRIKTIETGTVVDEAGTTHGFDLIFVAVGVRPSRVFEDSSIAVGPDGGMRVNRYLQSVAYDNIFGGGDCIYFQDKPLDKVGVFAVRQNPIIRHNLMAALDGDALRPFSPGGNYLLIFNLGDDTGIFYKWPLIFGGRVAFWLKDHIDRAFMKTYQANE